MRKTLLLTAAALTVGIITTKAQVYSANVVGYINLTLKPGFNLIANQLNNGNNNINVVLTNLPASLENATVQGWDFASQNFAQADTYIGGLGWVDGDFNSSTNSLKPGYGYFLNNPGVEVTVTLVGEVPQGTNTTSIQGPGFGLYASVPPVVSGFSTNGFPANPDETYQLFDATSQNYAQAITYVDGLGWVDQDFNAKDPAPPVGAGFLISNPGATAPWVRVFNVL